MRVSGCVNVCIYAVNVSVRRRVSVHIYNVRIRVALCPPAHMSESTGALTVETSGTAATLPHTPVPRGCSEGARLVPASTSHMQTRAVCPAPLTPRGMSWKDGASFPPLSPCKSGPSPSSVSSHPQSLNLSIPLCPLSHSKSLLSPLIHSPQSSESDLLEMQISSPPHSPA